MPSKCPYCGAQLPDDDSTPTILCGQCGEEIFSSTYSVSDDYVCEPDLLSDTDTTTSVSANPDTRSAASTNTGTFSQSEYPQPSFWETPSDNRYAPPIDSSPASTPVSDRQNTSSQTTIHAQPSQPSDQQKNAELERRKKNLNVIAIVASFISASFLSTVTGLSGFYLFFVILMFALIQFIYHLSGAKTKHPPAQKTGNPNTTPQPNTLLIKVLKIYVVVILIAAFVIFLSFLFFMSV